MEKLKTAKEISIYLGLDVQRIYDLTRRDLLPYIKIGERQYRYSETAILSWIEKGGNKENGDAANIAKN